MVGPITPLAQRTHQEKYCSLGETFPEAMSRIANALKDDDLHYHEFREIILNQRFLPAGRVQAAMGATKRVTAFNCYVSGLIEDSFIDGEGSIMQRATEAAATMRMGGGIGYDFSRLRPRGELIRSLQSRASGPVSFMGIYDAVCQTVMSAGHRRGAQMGVLRVDHPDSEEFVKAKQNSTNLTGFNVSLAVTDEFMHAVINGTDFDLRWNGKVYKTIDARNFWEQIMRSTWEFAEPGVLFIDRINEMNNLYYCEEISATNPCAEQPLPPFGACLLGSFNLVKYVEPVKIDKNFGLMSFRFNWRQLDKDIGPVVRSMDNVNDRTIFPLEEQKREAKSKRRMGLGVTGLANAAEALGYPYGSKAFVRFEGKVLRRILEGCYQASAILAKEKGSFKLFDREKYSKSKFVKILSKKTQDMIWEYGIRNSHLTSIAPTGTISICADNVSSGVEPVFAHSIKRTIIGFDGPQIERIDDYGLREFGVSGKISSECTAQDHLDVLIEAYKHVDSAVSKTCNVSPDMPWEDFKRIYLDAWKGGCKGCTTYNPGGHRAPMMEAEEEEETAEACYIDPTTGRTHCE